MSWIPEKQYQEILKFMPRPCVDVIIVHKTQNFGLKKVLLLKRAIEPCKDVWALPGGMQNKGETVLQACVRKAKEETGIDLKINDFNLVCIEDSFAPERQDTCMTYVAEVSNDTQVKLDFQHTEFAWVSIYALPVEMSGFVAKQIEKAKRYLHA